MENSKQLSVLLVEDNRMFRNLAFHTLAGNNRICAVNAEEGVDKFRKYSPDITFLDIGLPDGNGLDVLREIKKINPEAFVVMLTASRISSDVEQALQRGAAGYIVKPFTTNKVKEYFIKYEIYKKNLLLMSEEERMKQNSKILASVLESVNDNVQPRIFFSEHILFVDDFLANRTAAKKELEQTGFTVDVAENAEDAVQLFIQKAYKVIVIDTNMPGMNGYVASNQIRNHEKEQGKEEAIIIGLIESKEEAANRKWLQAGMNNYMVKPISFEQLVAMIGRYLR